MSNLLTPTLILTIPLLVAQPIAYPVFSSFHQTETFTPDTSAYSLTGFIDDDFPEWADGIFTGVVQKDMGIVTHIFGHLKLGKQPQSGIFKGWWNSTSTNKTGHLYGIFHQGFILGYATMTKTQFFIPLLGILNINKTDFTVRIQGSQALGLTITGNYLASFLPPLTGPYAIGTQIFHLIDTSREEKFTDDPYDKREVMMQLWYPRENISNGPIAPYMDPVVFNWLKQQSPIPLFMIPDHAYTFVTTHAILNASPIQKNGYFPLILFSHGYDGVRSIYTSLIEDIVSHGYVIAAIDHPYIAGITVFPDGHIITLPTISPNPNEAEQYFQKAFDSVIGDLAFVLDYLTNLTIHNKTWKNLLDLSHVGVYGHSFGGGAAAMLCNDDRITAGIALDGYFRGDIITQGLSTPFLMILAEGRFARDNTTQILWQNSATDIFRAEIEGSAHYGYTDVGILLDHLAPIIPKKLVGFGTITPKRLVKICNAYNLAFFNIYLKGEPLEPLLTLTNIYPEVNFTYKQN
jgi:dienelactone hydrolase